MGQNYGPGGIRHINQSIKASQIQEKALNPSFNCETVNFRPFLLKGNSSLTYILLISGHSKYQGQLWDRTGERPGQHFNADPRINQQINNDSH